MGNVISLQAIRQIKESKTQDQEYQEQIRLMNKLELLEEMVRFQEERTSAGQLSPSMMVRGKILFKALEQTAETQELKLLTRSYRRHLEYELAAFLKNPEAQVAESDEAAES